MCVTAAHPIEWDGCTHSDSLMCSFSQGLKGPRVKGLMILGTLYIQVLTILHDPTIILEDW